jgi:hypothetical protein
MLESAEEYPWSSVAAHCGLRESELLSADVSPPGVVEDWAAWLRVDADDNGATERMLQRPPRPKRGGRPRTKRNA